MGCHSYGPHSSKILELTGWLDTATVDAIATGLLDLRPSEVPEWADRDWFRQRAINYVAVQAGELDADPEDPRRR